MAIGFGVRQGNPRTAREVAMLAAALSTTKVAIFPKSGNRIQEKVERGLRLPHSRLIRRVEPFCV